MIQGVKEAGVWKEKPDDVMRCFFDHFLNKFKRVSTVPLASRSASFKTISALQVDLLEANISLMEVKNAVWDCGNDKAPGPDGFTFGFIKAFWDIFKDDVLQFVAEFFRCSRIPPGCNSSFITLIPKVSNPLVVDDFRPISLIGFQYKVIAKVLANRLSKVIDSVISNSQSAFIKGRQILDEPLILNEIVHNYRRKKKKGHVSQARYCQGI